MKPTLIAFSFLTILISCQPKEPAFLDTVDLKNLDGASLDKDALSGKIIILNLWATWCKPCVQEMPSLEVLQSELPSDKFVLLLASDEPLEKIRKFKQQSNFELEFIKLESSLESLGVFALPTTIFIDQKGNRSHTESGGKDWGSDGSVQEILKLY